MFDILPTSSFQTQKAKGSYWPIFEVETDFVPEEIHLPFAVRENSKGRLDSEKVAVENGPRTKKWPIFVQFKTQKANPYTFYIHFSSRLKLKVQPSSSKRHTWKLKL